jgi:hypothetical protein
MYLSVQNYPPGNPRPYDDTGWTMQYLRNVKVTPVKESGLLEGRMRIVSTDVRPPGGIEGWGATLILEHTTDNALMAFRYRNLDMKMFAAEDEFEVSGRKFPAGSFLMHGVDRDKVEPRLKELGLRAWATAVPPSVKNHELTPPRIGYIHSWARTQDEGWVRGALDAYGIPYTYFSDQKLPEMNLRTKFDVIIFPHTGGTSQSMLTGIPKSGTEPIPYKKSELTPNLGTNDESDDIRGGMGMEGLMELARFVAEGGTLITEGSTAMLMAEFNLTGGVTVERPAGLFARGSVMRGTFTDAKSPIAYGYTEKDLPIYFNQDPVFAAARSTAVTGAAPGFAGAQNMLPNAGGVHLSTLESNPAAVPSPAMGGPGPVSPGSVPMPAPPSPAPSNPAPSSPSAGPPASFFSGPSMVPIERPRVVMTFPANVENMLLSGTLAGGEALSGRALAVDQSFGKGHIVMFALRPFWRWQTQGSFFLAFNAILNWDHLDAGKLTK